MIVTLIVVISALGVVLGVRNRPISSRLASVALLLSAGFLTAFQFAKHDPVLSLAVGLNDNEKSTRAFNRLLTDLRDMAEILSNQPAGNAEAYRAVLHQLAAGLEDIMEQRADAPEFRPVITTTRKVLGDHPDAIYHETIINPSRDYVIQGNMAGAVYVSVTVHSGKDGNDFGGKISGVLNSDHLSIEPDGSFEIRLGPNLSSESNYIQLSKDATDIMVRHYYERASRVPVTADLSLHTNLRITPLGSVQPPAAPSDESIAADIDRVRGYFWTRLSTFADRDKVETPPFVSTVPNEFVRPMKPGSLVASNADAAYAMAPYLLNDDEALVITGRMPSVRMANVVLWNPYLQSYDYRFRQISLNRKQMKYEEDGSFKVIVAHRDPGHPNWLDTEERPFGFIYWRFLLPDGEIDELKTEVVNLPPA